ncbi:uncharacterized protein LOC135690441 [Rhopilema esculentum]|uniref:uncharacterized protein LOC135690441 n=1 Tax=Rhopilema esculentum TaxID=499914 RepID=UPI0031D74F9F
MEMKTDASLQGWGATCQNISTGGLWSFDEKHNHINYLEMYSIFLALKTYANDLTDKHIKILSDNSTAVLVLSHMGTSRSITCNNLCKQIWFWCIERNIWLTLAHIPGKQNIEADRESRRSANTSAEWKLNSKILQSCLTDIGLTPSVDLFASRLNKQFDKFVSFKPEPEAFAIDAFTLDWSTYKFYAFPPFSLITRMLKKIQIDQAEGIRVLPNWPTQPWYSKPQIDEIKANFTEAKSLIASAAFEPFCDSSPLQQPSSRGMSLISQKITTSELSSSAKHILLSSWRPGTQKQYNSYLDRWKTYCAQNSIQVFNPTIEQCIEFLTSLFDSGLGYTAINTARSALSSIITLSMVYQ